MISRKKLRHKEKKSQLRIESDIKSCSSNQLKPSLLIKSFKLNCILMLLNPLKNLKNLMLITASYWKNWRKESQDINLLKILSSTLLPNTRKEERKSLQKSPHLMPKKRSRNCSRKSRWLVMRHRRPILRNFWMTWRLRTKRSKIRSRTNDRRMNCF